MYAKHPEMRPFGAPKAEDQPNPLRDTLAQTVKVPGGHYLLTLGTLADMWAVELRQGDPHASKLLSKMWGECTYMPLGALRPIDTGRMRQERSGNWVPVLIDPLN